MMKFKSCIYPHIPLNYLCLNSTVIPFLYEGARGSGGRAHG